MENPIHALTVGTRSFSLLPFKIDWVYKIKTPVVYIAITILCIKAGAHNRRKTEHEASMC